MIRRLLAAAAIASGLASGPAAALPSTAAITFPGNGYTYQAPATVPVSVAASD
jgi:hypothetical protein